MTALESLLAQLEEAEASATPGPWFFDGYSKVCEPVGYGTEKDILDYFIAQTPVTAGDTGTKAGIVNASFIALSRNSIKRLIEIIRVQREALESISGCKPAGQHNDGLGHIAMIDMVILPTAKQTIKRCDEIAG